MKETKKKFTNLGFCKAVCERVLRANETVDDTLFASSKFIGFAELLTRTHKVFVLCAIFVKFVRPSGAFSKVVALCEVFVFFGWGVVKSCRKCLRWKRANKSEGKPLSEGNPG